MKKRIRTQGMLIALGVILFLSFSRLFLRRSSYPMPQLALDAAGLSLFLAGFLLRVSARGYKAEKPEGTNVLMTGGPYGWCRNPMYVGTFLIGSGFLLMFAPWWGFLVYLAVFAAIYIPQTQKETSVLLKVYGPAYEAYRRRVPGFLPGLRTLFSGPFSVNLPIKPGWVRSEASSLAACLTVMLLLRIWECHLDPLAEHRFEGILFLSLAAVGGVLYFALLSFTRGRRRRASRRNA